RFTLRQVLYDQPRPTEMFIVITLYNEDEGSFARTMHGVMKNIAHLCSRTRSKVWGKEGWRKVVVCVVADGRTKYDLAVSLLTLGSTLVHLPCWLQWVYIRMVSPRTLSMANLSQLISSNTQPKLVLIRLCNFGGPIQISTDNSGAQTGIMPCQIIFCLKEKNQKKINSHRWFFQAFGPILQPIICILLDCGTRPGRESLYHLWKAFDLHSNIAGAC